MDSKLFSINLKDFGRGAIVVIFTAVLGFLYQLIQDKGLHITTADMQELLKVAITVFIAYLGKNFFSNSDGQFGRSEK
jgi:hypothetical protein